MSERALPSQALLDAAAALESALCELGRPHMIIGGIAVIVRGIPRQTDDVDATIAAEGLDLEKTVAVLARHGITGRIADLLDFARKHQVLLLRHESGDSDRSDSRMAAF